MSAGICTQASTSFPLLNLLECSEVTHVIGGSQFDRPWHSQCFEDQDDSVRGERNHEKEGGGGKSCQLSEAVNGDFVILPQVFFFFLQNQSLIEPRPKPACLALPRGKTAMLFISQLEVVLREVLIVLHMPHCGFSAATGSTVVHCDRPLLRAGLINAVGM